MARKSSGQVIETTTRRGRTFALRFHAYGQRRYVTLGAANDGWTQMKAEAELALILAQVKLGRWQPEQAAPAPEVREDPGFHRFASDWMASVQRDLADRTIRDYQWRLTDHLLPFFASHSLRAITVQKVDRRHVPRRVMLATLAFTGLRLGEALALRWRTSTLPQDACASTTQRPTLASAM